MKHVSTNKWPLNVYVIILWIILTAFNITKAYHIDDTFHLEAAEYLKQHPLKPMSGYINWGNSPTPMYTHNQPPLFFYMIMLFQMIFGKNEIPMHLLLSVFTLLSLLYFNKLTILLNIKYKKLLLTIFAFCPAFIVNQNLMTDVPILSISLAIIYYLIIGQRSESIKYYLIAVILLSVGLLIKYSLLPLILVILFLLILSNNNSKFVLLLIPIFVLSLWSVWNLYEFGAVHLFNRPGSEFHIDKIWAFTGTLGAVSTFTIIYIYFYFQQRIILYSIIFIYFLFTLSVPAVYFGIIEEKKFNVLLNYLFIINGLILMIIILKEAIHSFVKEKKDYFKTPYFTIVLYILGVSAFIALFAPFNATRHILLLIPFILLFTHKQFEISHRLIKNLVLTGTIILGVMLGISDWLYADFYRVNALKINSADSKVWSIGHWGWQWYSKKNGMIIYSQDDEGSVRKSDIIVFPKDISKQELNTDIKLDTLKIVTQETNFLTFFSGKNFASMYNSHATKPAWSLSNIPIDTIFICKVINELKIEGKKGRHNSVEQSFR